MRQGGRTRAVFAYAGPGIKLSDDSGAGERRLTGFSVCSAVGRRMMALETPASRCHMRDHLGLRFATTPTGWPSLRSGQDC
jgi:hypothetical protein